MDQEIAPRVQSILLLGRPAPELEHRMQRKREGCQWPGVLGLTGPRFIWLEIDEFHWFGLIPFLPGPSVFSNEAGSKAGSFG